MYGAVVLQWGFEEIKEPHHMLVDDALVVRSPYPPDEYHGMRFSIPLSAYDQPSNTVSLVTLVFPFEEETNE